MASYLGGLTRSAADHVRPDHDYRPGSPAVDIADLTRRYGDRVVLDHIDLQIRAGEFVALIGRSGSGKSTLLRALARLDYDVEGVGLLTVPDRISVVFQDSRLLPWERVLGNVTLGLRAERPPAGGQTPEQRGRASLAEVGLAGRERAWPSELSGGEQQRVALARSLVRDPQLLLADEPFGALDALTRFNMHGLLRTLCDTHRPAVLLVTHDVDEAITLADRVIVLDQGRIVSEVGIDMPAPRSPADPHFAAARTQLLNALGLRENADD
ncbi:MAG TPA: ABC transporter ATP-binding protein [Propionibacteriaceae bacterium]|nr:ABC transporter ATP-binding protein [Propionibacteriaceae bacterium]